MRQRKDSLFKNSAAFGLALVGNVVEQNQELICFIIRTFTTEMKSFLFFAVLLGALCISYSAPSYSSDQEVELQAVFNQLLERESKAQEVLNNAIETQDDKTALAQLYFRLLENEVQKQGLSDEDMAEMQSILDKLRAFGRKVKNAFNKLGKKIKSG